MHVWRCEKHKSQCPGRVTTCEGSVQSSRGEHNHPPDLAANKVEAAISNMRKRAREETVTISRMYDETLQVIIITNYFDSFIRKCAYVGAVTA